MLALAKWIGGTETPRPNFVGGRAAGEEARSGAKDGDRDGGGEDAYEVEVGAGLTVRDL